MFGSTSTKNADTLEDIIPTLKHQPTARYGYPVELTSLEFTIMGLRKEDIHAVKMAIDRCCTQESKDMLIQEKEYSDIIKILNNRQVIMFVVRSNQLFK